MRSSPTTIPIPIPIPLPLPLPSTLIFYSKTSHTFDIMDYLEPLQIISTMGAAINFGMPISGSCSMHPLN
jgi:hypothetical protein